MPGLARKIHSKPMPFMGGLAVFLALLFGMCVYAGFGAWDFAIVPAKFAFGIAAGGLVLMVGGFFDDRYSLPARITWIFPALAAAVVMWFGVGVGITFLTNPFGGVIPLTAHVLGVSFSTLFVWVWIMGMTYTTKLLDGLDGLAAGVSLIGGLTMFFLSLTTRINQPITATLAILFTGALAGYLVYAFNPASIFLGEGGSTFLGFFLAVLSVLTGAKIATAVLVMGIPIFDVAWAIVRRVIRGHSPFQADREHLHHLLLDAGLSQRQAVLVFYAFAAAFGFFAVFLQSLGKLVALVFLLVAMVGLLGFLASVYRNKKATTPTI
jgi:UDP-GlcNAc:undecaprenyl-phosphate GlcNAc-1-phosphate transferase